MPAGLDQIVSATRRRIAREKAEADLRKLEAQAQGYSPRGFRRQLVTAASSGIAVIAELKKASPSRGLIRADFDPAVLAQELQRAGASALSVLTEEDFFQGSLHNLRIASASTHLPCLRKDFIMTEFQLLQARAFCADAVLLIVAALAQDELKALVRGSRELSLDVLCEAHDDTELERALDAGCDLIGINNRDLRTFKVNLETSLRLAPLIPKHVVSVAESGIRDGADIGRLRAAGYQAFLIGESLMQAATPGEALRNLLTETVTARASD
jgi:indole-3-glycerol phosphate synthase